MLTHSRHPRGFLTSRPAGAAVDGSTRLGGLASTIAFGCAAMLVSDLSSSAANGVLGRLAARTGAAPDQLQSSAPADRRLDGRGQITGPLAVLALSSGMIYGGGHDFAPTLVVCALALAAPLFVASGRWSAARARGCLDGSYFARRFHGRRSGAFAVMFAISGPLLS